MMPIKIHQFPTLNSGFEGNSLFYDYEQLLSTKPSPEIQLFSRFGETGLFIRLRRLDNPGFVTIHPHV